MVEVTWQGLKLSMFGSDLLERGEENFHTETVVQHPEFVNSDQIRQLLQDDFDAAQERRISASKRFTEILNDIPSGIPHPDGTDRIRLASGEYKTSLNAATAAMKRLSDFIRCHPLIQRKRRLERIVTGHPSILFAQHIESHGCQLFQHVCEQDLEGIVAKRKDSAYGVDWFKIRNPTYSQYEGRRELFEKRISRSSL